MRICLRGGFTAQMQTLDIRFFYIAFWLYLAGFIAFSVYVPFRKVGVHRVATAIMALGLIPQTAGIVLRWIQSEHVPLSNMYEYMSLMSWMAVIILLVLIRLYKRPLVGSFIAPLVFMLMVTASLLPKDVSQSLVPALQSYWITIHVTLAALGSGAFVVACAVSFVYLLKVHKRNLDSRFPALAMRWWITSFIIFPIAFFVVLKILGFNPLSNVAINLGGGNIAGAGSFLIALGMALPLAALMLSLIFHYTLKDRSETHYGSSLFAISTFALLLAALIAGFANSGGIFTLTERSPLRIFEFFGVVLILFWPTFFISYTVLYVLDKKYIGKIELDLNLLDEINYKAIALGYPLYTIGALFAGAIWAEQAWGSFWSWDPKEVGSLIIWLFYSGFLHARYHRQWRGSKAAILAVFGFLMVIMSFFGNYFFGGQHAYT